MSDDAPRPAPRPLPVPQAPPAIKAGFRCGPYTLLHTLGEGYRGVVWAARTDSCASLAAVKVMKDDPTPLVRELFGKEIQILSRLSSPCIPALLDSGAEADGLLWYAMEYIDGETIYSYCRKTPLSLDRIAVIIRKLCETVCYLYRHNIVHRDLNFSNVVVDRNGIPHLVDFGLARERAGPDDKGSMFDVEGLVSILYDMAATKAAADARARNAARKDFELSGSRQKLLREYSVSAVRELLAAGGCDGILNSWPDITVLFRGSPL